MVKCAHILLILAVAGDINAQFFDFFTAFKPPTLRPIFEPTKSSRLRPYLTTERYHENGRIRNIEHTTKSIRKTTKSSKQSSKKSKIDKIIDDGRNTINYENPRSKTYTENPFARPGVKPAVVNGPPITNKPPYVPRPIAGLGQSDDGSVTPELIIGPDEDYMTSAEKQRYIELAEKKCEQYTALTTVRVEAIPLVPSPSPLVVNVSSCARSVPLVVGGNLVTIQQFPHMALLGWTKVQSGGYSWKCGGSLVSERHVLTAAHCAYQERDDSVSIGPPRAVQLGSSRLDDRGAIVQRVSSVTRHPRYRAPQSYHDIAVVTMVAAVTFSSAIRPACMGAPPSPGEHFIATGWGKTEFGGEQSSQLRGVSLSVWSRTDCSAALGNTRKLPRGPDGSQTCAGERDGGKDTCQGDSGGPAQVSRRCAWCVVAVTSAGRSCGAPGTPALYANVPMAFVAKVAFGRLDRDEQPYDHNTNTNSNRPQNDNRQQSRYNNQNSYSNSNNNNSPNSDNQQNEYDQVSGNSNRRPNDYNQQNKYNRGNGNNQQSRFHNQNNYNNSNNYNSPNNDNQQNEYDQLSGNSNRRPNDYNQENKYNRGNENNQQSRFNNQNSHSNSNNNNSPNSDNQHNEYDQLSGNSNRRPNDYNQENKYNRGNGNNQQSRFHNQNNYNNNNNYNSPNSDNQHNEYDQLSGNSNSRSNDYNQENKYNRGNENNQQPNSNNRNNNYDQENRHNQQNSNHQQNQWNKRTTTTPKWSENLQLYNDRRNNNYNNPTYMDNTDERYKRTDEYTTPRSQYYYSSLDRPYRDGNVWRT